MLFTISSLEDMSRKVLLAEPITLVSYAGIKHRGAKFMSRYAASYRLIIDSSLITFDH